MSRRSFQADAFWHRWSAAAPAWLIVGICAAPPLLWLAWQLIWAPALLPVAVNRYTLEVLARTLGCSAAAALLATAMAIPAALLIGRGRGAMRHVLLIGLPATLLLPSLVHTFAWGQLLDRLGLDIRPQGWLDLARCVWTLGSWLWGIPALGIGLAMRTLDPRVHEQAMLDGAPRRVTARLLIAPAAASFCAAMLLAAQEFAVYEKTGISVIATEVRAVFQTGVVSGGDWSLITSITGGAVATPDDHQRAAAALAIALPLIVVVFALCGVVVLFLRRFVTDHPLTLHAWPKMLGPSRAMTAVAGVLFVLNAVVPVGALIASLSRTPDTGRILSAFGPHVGGSLLIGGMTGGMVLAAAAMWTVRRGRVGGVVSLAAFLIGGQICAIAAMRLCNRPALNWLYGSAMAVSLVHAGLLLWIGALAARQAWSSGLRELRDMAAIDGAGSWQAAARVIWPLIWPVLTAAAVLAGILSITEVPAAMLLQPLNPPVMVTPLMTWIHMQRSDDMIELSLLMLCIVLVLAGALLLIVRWARRTVLVVPVALLLCGCGKSEQPEAVWLKTGMGPGQVVYPRGIAYDKGNDWFYVVDRAARVQRLDRDGNCLNMWQMPEQANGKPVGISVGPDGNVYIPDTHYSRVMVYSPRGELLCQWGASGTAPGQFIWPTDVAFDSAGNIYVSEYSDNDRIQVFAACDIAKGPPRLLRVIGRHGTGRGEFARPQSILIHGDLLYVANASVHRVDVLTLEGKFIRSIGSVGSGLGQFRFPYGLDIDAKGRLVVCEFGNNRVQLVDRESGRGLATWGSGGREPGQLAYPWAVAVDRAGRIIVVDSGNNRLQLMRF